jgi:hypothetical protein
MRELKNLEKEVTPHVHRKTIVLYENCSLDLTVSVHER